MTSPSIKLAYKQVIDQFAQSEFEKNIFSDSYAELLMQAPVYNREKKFNTVVEMIEANPKANSLHYKVGFAIGLYVDTLNKKIPGLIDSLGNSVSFDIFKTEIVYSDVTDRSKHVIALTYLTAPLKLIDSFGQHLLLSKLNTEITPDEIETFTISLQPNLSVVSYQMSD